MADDFGTLIKEYFYKKGKYTDEDKYTDEFFRTKVNDLLKTAKGRSFSMYVPKFIHPDIGKNDIGFHPFYPRSENDGYLRTGKVPDYMDSFGNAAQIELTDLLSLIIGGKPLFLHIQNQTEILTEFSKYLGQEEDAIYKTVSEMLKQDSSLSTDERLKQVYFPAGDNDSYFIISPLFSMPVVTSFNDSILKNSDYNNNPVKQDSKKARSAQNYELKNDYLEGGYWQVPGLVKIKYGGSKPQNISKYNSISKGLFFIKSLPPKINKRKVRIPKRSLLHESINRKSARYFMLFENLDKLFKIEKNNQQIRKDIKIGLLNLLQELALDIAVIRNEIKIEAIPYSGELEDDEYLLLYGNDERFENHDWLESISGKISRWFFESYVDVIKNPVCFSDAEYEYVRQIIINNKEILIQ